MIGDIIGGIGNTIGKVGGAVGGVLKSVGQGISSLDPTNIRKTIAGFTNFNLNRGSGTSISYVGDITGANSPSDWRVYLIDRDRYLVNDYDAFQPLKDTSNGIVFPYTPTIQMNYRAQYENIQGVQTNYAIPTYQQSMIDTISIRGTFTANSRSEAQYLLTVLHFLRSATKSRFGSDPLAGTPPPILYLRGYGEGMFNDVPVVITSAQYSLPADVDYIDIGSPVSKQVQKAQDRALTITRDDEGNILPGADAADEARILARGDLDNGQINSNSLFKKTKVPTEIEIDLQLQVIYKRSELKNLSSRDFFSGDLVKKGFL
jgi:hypothetical protein